MKNLKILMFRYFTLFCVFLGILISLLCIQTNLVLATDNTNEKAGYSLRHAMQDLKIDKNDGIAFLPGSSKKDAEAYTNGSPEQLTGMFQNIMNGLAGMAAAVAIFFIVINAMKLTFSAGESDEITNAKKSISWSLAGLLLIIFSYIIAKTIISTTYVAQDQSDEQSEEQFDENIPDGYLAFSTKFKQNGITLSAETSVGSPNQTAANFLNNLGIVGSPLTSSSSSGSSSNSGSNSGSSSSSNSGSSSSSSSSSSSGSNSNSNSNSGSSSSSSFSSSSGSNSNSNSNQQSFNHDSKAIYKNIVSGKCLIESIYFSDPNYIPVLTCSDDSGENIKLLISKTTNIISSDSAHNTSEQNHSTSNISSKEIINVYKSLLNKEPTDEQLKNWLIINIPKNEMENLIKQSTEYKNKQQNINSFNHSSTVSNNSSANNTCTDEKWLPDLSLKCKGSFVKQTSNCGNSRYQEGKKICNNQPFSTVSNNSSANNICIIGSGDTIVICSGATCPCSENNSVTNSSTTASITENNSCQKHEPMLDEKEALDCNDTSIAANWYKEKGRCGEPSGIKYWNNEIKKKGRQITHNIFNATFDNYCKKLGYINNKLCINSIVCKPGFQYDISQNKCLKNCGNIDSLQNNTLNNTSNNTDLSSSYSYSSTNSSKKNINNSKNHIIDRKNECKRYSGKVVGHGPGYIYWGNCYNGKPKPIRFNDVRWFTRYECKNGKYRYGSICIFSKSPGAIKIDNMYCEGQLPLKKGSPCNENSKQNTVEYVEYNKNNKNNKPKKKKCKKVCKKPIVYTGSGSCLSEIICK
jgi:uncharacterized membrane protein YgcG